MSLRLLRVFGSAVQIGPARTTGQRFGLPTGGAFDRESAALVKALVPTSSVWEVTGSGSWTATEDGSVAWAGSGHSVRVAGVEYRGGGRSSCQEGDLVEILAGPGAGRAYLSFGLGILPELRLSSTISDQRPIRVVEGPQASDGLDAFLAHSWQVSPVGDRVGLRLTGPVVGSVVERPSEPSCVGAIQLTSGGVPIILGPDGPTIGGYPKIAVVIDADLDRVGRAAVGSFLSFQLVSMDEAREASRRERERIRRRLAEISIVAGRR